MAVFSRLLLSKIQFVYGAYVMARQSVSAMLLAVTSIQLPLVQTDDISLPEMMMGI
jgi:hypothetical protein